MLSSSLLKSDAVSVNQRLAIDIFGYEGKPDREPNDNGSDGQNDVSYGCLVPESGLVPWGGGKHAPALQH